MATIWRSRIEKAVECAIESLVDLASQRDDPKVALEACRTILDRGLGDVGTWSKQLELDLRDKPEPDDGLDAIERKIAELTRARRSDSAS